MPHQVEPPVCNRYYTPDEIRRHDHEDDCWVSIDRFVYDLTSLLKQHREYLSEGDILCKPIIKAAGTDISHWFQNGQVKTFVDKESGITQPYTPNGRFLHVPPSTPSSNWLSNIDISWWQDESYRIGFVTKHVRRLKIYNTLTAKEDTMDVCVEEKLQDVQQRYIEKFNSNAKSYTWKFTGKLLDMEKTLDENSIPDVSSHMQMVGLNEEEGIPTIHLYFNDDFGSYN